MPSEVSPRPWRFDPRPHKHSLGMILDAAGAPVCSFGGDNLSTGEQYAGFAPDDADVEFILNAVNGAVNIRVPEEEAMKHYIDDAPLHRLWTRAVGTEGYDKAEWTAVYDLVWARCPCGMKKALARPEEERAGEGEGGEHD